MKLYRRLGEINAGFLKDRAQLMAPSYVTDNYGQTTITYTLQQEVWAGVKNASNSRQLQEAQVIFEDASYLYIRYGVQITADYQIIFEGKTYTIYSIQDIENRFQYYQILMYSKKL